MPNSLVAALQRSTVATFENLAMMVAQPTGDHPDPCMPPHVTNIWFQGKDCECLELEMPPSLLAEVAVSMLGTNVFVGPNIIRDVLGEFANVIAGNLLEYFGAAETTALSSPMPGPCGFPGKPVARARFVVDEYFVEARLFLQVAA